MGVGRREVSFGGSAVAVEYEGRAAAWVVDFLYRYVAPMADTPPQITYRVLEKEGGLFLYRGAELLVAGGSQGAVADWLLGDSCHYLAGHSRGGLLFHAAALARRGCRLILPGTIGAGKSTLAAWLAAHGWMYLTDELVFVSAEGDRLAALTRPLNLKRPSLPPLSGWFDLCPSEHVLPTPQGVLLSPALLNAAPPGVWLEQQFPVVFLLPHYVPGGEFELQPLSPAQTGLALMECLVNARNLADHGFAQAARLARQSPGYRLRYSHFDQLGEQIAALPK